MNKDRDQEDEHKRDAYRQIFTNLINSRDELKTYRNLSKTQLKMCFRYVYSEYNWESDIQSEDDMVRDISGEIDYFARPDVADTDWWLVSD